MPVINTAQKQIASDQIILIIDLKAAKLKDLSNKQLNSVFRTLLTKL